MDAEKITSTYIRELEAIQVTEDAIEAGKFNGLEHVVVNNADAIIVVSTAQGDQVAVVGDYLVLTDGAWSAHPKEMFEKLYKLAE